MAVPIPFNPSQCVYALYPYNTNHPTIQLGSNNNTVGYLQAVLKCTSNQSISIHANPGPWYFGTSTRTALRNFQAYWSLTVDGICGPQTWPVINWAAVGFPT